MERSAIVRLLREHVQVILTCVFLVVAIITSVQWALLGSAGLEPVAVLAQCIVALFSLWKRNRFTVGLTGLAFVVTFAWLISDYGEETKIELYLGIINLLALIIRGVLVEAETNIDYTKIHPYLLERAEGIIKQRFHPALSTSRLLRIRAVNEIIPTFKEKSYYSADPEHVYDAFSLIYDKFYNQDRLLILGGPGSGKSTCLLYLAQELLKEAAEDSKKRIPIIFRLSIWSRKHKDITELVLDELENVYGISRPIGLHYINNRIIFLFDALDEVNISLREECVEKIEEFYKKYTPGIIMCCRTVDFMDMPNLSFLVTYNNNENQIAVARSITITNQGEYKRHIVSLLGLSDAQIDEYLRSIEGNTDAIRSAIFTDKSLYELARSLFLLRAMAFTYVNKPVVDYGSTENLEVIRTNILDSYVEETFRHRARKEPSQIASFTKEQTLKYLSNVARYLYPESEHDKGSDANPEYNRARRSRVLYIDRIQPSILSPGMWIQYALIVTITVGLVGGVVGSIGVIPFLSILVSNQHLWYGILTGALVVATAAALYGGTSIGGWGFAVTIGLTWGFSNWLPESNLLITSGMSSFIVGFISQYNLNHKYFVPSDIGFKIYLFRLLCGIISGTIIAAGISTYFSLPFNWLTDALTFFVLGMLGGAGAGYLITPLFSSFMARLKVIKGTNENEIIPREELQWSWLGAAAFFGITFIVGLVISSIVGAVISSVLPRLLAVVFLLALTMGAVGAFVTKGRKPDIRVRARPNYAIWESLWSAAKVSAVGVGLGVIAWFVLGDWWAGVLYMIAIICAAIITSGGFAFLQHFTLRGISYLNDYLPWNIIEFLNYTSELMLTRRVGASYEFTHEFLLRHFAKKGD